MGLFSVRYKPPGACNREGDNNKQPTVAFDFTTPGVYNLTPAYTLGRCCCYPPSSQPASADEDQPLAVDGSAARRRRSATPLRRG